MEYLVYVNVIILNAKHPIILCLHASILEEDAIVGNRMRCMCQVFVAKY